MAPRSTWKGDLKLSLVTIPVRLYSATEAAEKISFHRLHATKEDGSPCLSTTNNKVWCPKCNKEVPSGNTVKGYEHAKGQHVVVTDDELDAIGEASSGVLEITGLLTDPINPLYVDGTLLMLPEETPAAQQAFETIRQALGDRTAGGTVVLRNKPTLVALQPEAHGFIVFKLRGAEQVRTFDTITTPLNIVPPKTDLALAKQLFATIDGTFSYETARDAYNDNLKALLQAKINGTALPTPELPMKPAVASLSAALADSLALAQAAKAEKLPSKAGKPAKATVAAKAAGKKKSA